MTLGASHLVCLILLLSALRGAEGSVLPAGDYGFDGRYGVVLSQDGAGVWTRVALIDHGPGGNNGNGNFFLDARAASSIRSTLQSQLSGASRAASRAVWAMRPPAAHCATLFAITNA